MHRNIAQAFLRWVLDNEILSVRVFDAPQAQLFKAWSDPALLQQWWGPKGFTNTFHEFDFKVHGKWKLTMHGPTGRSFPNECTFTRIEVPHLIMWDRVSKPLFQVAFHFEALGEKTRVHFRMIFASTKERDALKTVVIPSNEENFDRLEALLSQI